MHKYSRRCPSGALKGKPMASMSGRWLGPTPRRKRPGAREAITWVCCTVTSGWRGKVGTMDVPSLMRCVRTAAAAKVVRLSGRAIPVVIQAAGMPNCSARSIMASAPCAVSLGTATPISCWFMGFSHFLFIMIPIILLQPQASIRGKTCP